MAEQFQQVVDEGIQPDDPRYDDPENPENREFSTFETTYDGPYDSEGNPDPENRDDQDFSWESKAEEPTSVLSLRGANLDVINSLNAVTFLPGSACGMSEAIAYIRYWSRSGATQKTPVQQNAEQAIPDDPQAKLDEEVTNRYLQQQQEQQQEQSNTSTRTILSVPENTAYQSRPRQPIPVSTTTTSVADNKAGNVYSANPSGTSESAGTQTVSPPNDAVWQFLFNPEELQLSSGPEYNRAEAWGVSDPENSGQPLSWRMNRNRKLTFGKVLLHGYSFGKRVDSLEKGLQDLFMAREGEGADGPPVLEFVWGKRVFGPCVIQNIQVREKAWDKGILVNAEVSFELEQVPEWTINDGFVDVLRPGRQPTVNDPSLASENYRDTSTEPAGEKGAGSNKPPTGLPKNRERDLKITQSKCNLSENTYNKFLALSGNVSKQRRNLVGASADKTKLYQQSIQSSISSYQKLLVDLKNSTPGASKLNKAYEADEIRKSVNQYFLSNTNTPDLAKNKSIDLIAKAIEQALNLAKSYYTSETCTRIDGELKKLQDSKKSANEKLFLSRAIQENNSCSIGAGNTITNPKTGKVFRCEIKDRDPTITVYREIK